MHDIGRLRDFALKIALVTGYGGSTVAILTAFKRGQLGFWDAIGTYFGIFGPFCSPP